jgi:PDZ domain
VARHHGLISAATLAAALIAARAAFGADGCDEERGATGLGVAVQAGAVAVAAVAPDSPASRAGFRAGDVVLQANDVVPRTCAQWARAIGAARDGDKALLVLVRRGDAEVPLALGAATWRPPGLARAPGTVPAPGTAGVEARPGSPEAPPPPPPARAATPPPPPPLPADAAVSVDGVVRDLAALAPLDDPPTSLPAYREAVLHARREIETLASRNAAPAEVVADLRAVVRYYEGAAVAWGAIEGDREQERRSRRLPVPENLGVPYFSDSPVASLLDEFTFLDATIARQPRGVSLVEASGMWRPVWARLLLWERGAQALNGVRDRLGAAN